MIRLAPALVVVALLAAGCAGPTTNLPTAKRAVGLDLWVAPLAKDLDGRPGVDGLSLRLMLQDAASREPRMADDDDQIELLLFEGEPRQLADASAFHTWRQTAPRRDAPCNRPPPRSRSGNDKRGDWGCHWSEFRLLMVRPLLAPCTAGGRLDLRQRWPGVARPPAVRGASNGTARCDRDAHPRSPIPIAPPFEAVERLCYPLRFR